MGIIDYLTKIEELTNTNLKLLKTINDSFYTDKNHLSVNLENGSFVVPSFISLENKINALQDNFENLVKSPTTSDAYFVFDGNSRSIEVKGYEQSPAPLILENQNNFYYENNNVLKDFLTPVPYLKFNLSDIPNDINTVIVRKVSAISNEARTRLSSLLGGGTTQQANWGDIKKILDYLQEGVDYTCYDTTQRLPVRKGQGHGSYVVTELIDENIDDNLDQHISVRFANNIDGYQKSLTYLLFDQTIERNLSVGDYIVSWDGHVKYEVEKLNFNDNIVQMRVLFGDYTDLYPYDGTYSQIEDISKMRFFSEADLFSDNKYVKVPLEEDKYIFICIAPVNDRMNIRASWGDGLIVDVDGLTKIDDENVSFREYYNTCRNIGDILNEISKVMSNTTSSHTNDELNDYMNAVPSIDPSIIKVIHINKHLDDTPTIKNIRALYSQKNSYNADLTETQTSITTLQDQLATVDFQDTTGVRSSIQNQISELTAHKNELIDSLIKITNEIALAANNSVVPIENAKYRIRGFFDFVDFVNSKFDNNHRITPDNIKGIYVQYRYRNVQQETGTAETFVKTGEYDQVERTFIFSDWNELDTPLRPRVRNADGTYSAYEDTSNMNLPSFNQIDIPITQGENVDVRLKVVYDFGYPFIQMTSAWSDIVTFEFPEEFIKNVKITDIISENNNDIETNRFKSILSDNGVTAHVDDRLIDQDSTYFHKPENIASGFYTAERRVIPLLDKLKTMDNTLTRLSDEVDGTASEQLTVNVDFDESSITVSPYEVGNVTLKEYKYFEGLNTEEETTYTYGNYEFDGDVVSITCNIRLTNTSNRSLKIFSMFPATDTKTINSLVAPKFDKTDYCVNGGNYGVYISNPVMGGDRSLNLQTTNQIITFRVKNPYDGEMYYDRGSVFNTNNKLSYEESHVVINSDSYGMAVYPYVIQMNGLSMTYKEAYSYMLLNPGDEVIIPIMVQYKLQETGTSAIEKTISFDVRTSLYNDPYTYAIKFSAKYFDTAADKLVSSLTKKYQPKVLKDKEYRTIVR